MSSDDMMALMNNPELLMQSSSGGKSLLMGNNRDADGSIDRVRDPPEELKPLLKKIKRVIDERNIDIHNVLSEQGGTRYGTMSKQRFNSSIVILFEKDLIFSEADLFGLDAAYGTGSVDLHNKNNQSIAWMDFVEDICLTNASYMPAEMAPKLGFEGKKKPMSAFAMLMDASDGNMDGSVEGGLDGVKHTSLMGDKRWA